MMAMAMEKGPEYLEKLLAVRKEWDEQEAKKAFNFAISEFQRRAPIVPKLDKAYDKDYAKLDRIWRTIRPLLTELGLSVTWQQSTLSDGICRVVGKLRHRDGHGEEIIHDVPIPELIKGQNKAQQGGSATSYAKRYALCGALGIVTGEDLDDDGHAAGTRFVTMAQADEILDLFEACKGLDSFNQEAFFKYIGTDKVEEIPAERFSDVLNTLKRKLKSG